MWFFTTPVILALVPYFIYSVFHVVTYFSEYVLPAITSRPARPQEDKLAQLARKYQDTGSQTVAKVEVYGILIRLLLGVLMYPSPPLLRKASFEGTNTLWVGSTNSLLSSSPSLQCFCATNTSIQLTRAQPSVNFQDISTWRSILSPPP